MAGSLSRDDLIADHKAQLGASAKKFTAEEDADFVRHLNNAARAMSRIRRRTLVGELTLVAGQSEYVAPGDLISPKISNWGRGVFKPWDPRYSPLPRLTVYEGDGGMMLNLTPAPTAEQIACFGCKYTYFYLAEHQIGEHDSDTSFRDSDRDLCLLLAMIEAVRELAASGITEPVQLHRGMGAVSSNMTPAALLEVLTRQLERYQ